MFQKFDHRAGHYLLLIACWAVCCLPNLGTATLWDIDEGLNAEAAREMIQSGNYVVPTFNYKLRSAKPVLLYWLQAGCYHWFGVNEFAARLPSALAVLLAALATYELGRILFGVRTALLAGVILLTCVSVLGAAHFANPDGLLLAFTTLTLAFYYRYWQTKRFWWMHLAAASCGLAVLAKGPVGLLLPGAVVVFFLLWHRQLRQVIDLPLGEGILIFLLVAAPWYAWVGVETKGQFLREFWGMHHVNRVNTPMENHSGSPFYYVVIFLVGFFPWSIFLGPTIVHTWRRLITPSEERSALRLLTLWFVLCLGAFTYAKTKLPNYVLPMYPAGALLTAWMLERWRTREFALPNWIVGVSLTCLGLAGVGVSAGILIVSGAIEVPFRVSVRFPELLPWAWVGIFPIVGAVVASFALLRGHRERLLVVTSIASFAFVAFVAGGAIPALNGYKPSAYLASTLPDDHERREIRVGAYCYDRPSVVFYCRREVARLDLPEQAHHYLDQPFPTYVFVSELRWNEIEGGLPEGTRILGKFPDLYGKGGQVMVLANRSAP